MTDPGVVLGQQAGQSGEKHPAVSLALLLPQEEAGGGAEDHPGQVVDDDEEEQELQSVRGPERSGHDKYFIKDDLCVVPLPASPDDRRVDLAAGMVQSDPLEVVDQLSQQLTLLPGGRELAVRLVGGGEEGDLERLQAGIEQLGVELAGRHEATAESPPELCELAHTGEGGV